MKKDNYFNKPISYKLAYSILAFLVLAFITYGIFYSYNKQDSQKEKTDNFLDLKLINDDDAGQVDERFLDSDHDGAYDWVENLWPGLDPHNPDSDGDGVLDGQYIKQKQRIRAKERRGVDVESNLTESDKLGRGVYVALMAVQQTDGKIDEKTQEKISDNIVNYISDLPLGEKLYLREELNRVPDNEENSSAYKKAMEKLFEKYPVNTSEIKLILEASKEPKKYMAKLESASMKYNAYVHELASMNVPSLIAGRHTELLNAVGQLEGALKNLTLENYDDVVTLSSIVQIEKILGSVIDANSHIEKYFEIISIPGVFQ